MIDSIVLDASAILCLLNRERGAEKVADRLSTAIVSAVNLSEVAAKLADYAMPAEKVAAVLASLGIDVVPFDEKQALIAGALRPASKAAGLSFGDRACLSLAILHEGTAMTADRSWALVPLPPNVAVELVR